MSSVPWSNESERADYYKELYEDQLAICDRLDRHLQRYIDEVRWLERYRDDTQVEVSKDLERKIRSEAIKEFAERVKAESIEVDVSFGYGKEHYEKAVTVIAIKQIAKEMGVEL